MLRLDDRAIDDLMSAVGRECESADDELAYLDERFLFWLANDLRSGLDREQRSQDERDAAEFARRALTRLKVRLVEKRLPRRQLFERPASINAILAHSVPAASRERCATILDLAVAAGGGRGLWGEAWGRGVVAPAGGPSGPPRAMRPAGRSVGSLAR